MNNAVSPTFVLLAGGQSRRMGGGDKNLKLLGGRPLLTYVQERIPDPSAPVFINANGDPQRFSSFDLPVVADVVAGHAGPLAGILTAMEWSAEHYPGATHVISLATDAPFLPFDLVPKLIAAVEGGAEMAQAASKGRRHPVFAIWPIAARARLRAAVVDQGIRKIDDFTATLECAVIAFDGEPDPFMNLNTPEDFAVASCRLEELEGKA